MEKSDVRKYDAPRAVRLGDAKTGGMVCTNGRSGNGDFCESGFAVSPNNVCRTGLLVRG
jgi:hypothetical protein